MSLLLQQVLTHLTQDPTAHPSSLNVTLQAKHFGTVLYTREKQSPYDRRNSKNFQIYVFYRPQGKVMFPQVSVILSTIGLMVTRSLLILVGYLVTVPPFYSAIGTHPTGMLPCLCDISSSQRGNGKFSAQYIGSSCSQLNAVFRDLPSSQSIRKTSQKYTIQLRIQAKSQLCRTENESTNS